MSQKKILSKGSKQTKALGEKIGSLIKPGGIICLYGDLGTGKTLISKGIAKGLGVNEDAVKSPSYTILNTYKGKSDVNHIDLYRLEDHIEDELEEIGYRDLFYSDGVSIIEWAERMKDIIPDERLDITIKYKDKTTREITLAGYGIEYDEIIKAVDG